MPPPPGGVHPSFALVDLVNRFRLIAVVGQRVPGQIEMRIKDQSHRASTVRMVNEAEKKAGICRESSEKRRHIAF
jgi:hypothetical protein